VIAPYVVAVISDPYAIYDRARDAWRGQTYPGDLQYRTTIHVVEGGKDEFEHFTSESRDGGVRSSGVSEEEAEAPHDPNGIDFKIKITIGWNTGSGGHSETTTVDANKKDPSPDYLGVPLLNPNYAFGLIAAPETLQTREGITPMQKTLPTIATVTVVNRAYDISLAGIETIDGSDAYHLRLTASRDPKVFRLRDLWIDEASYRVLRLQTQGNFMNAPMTNIPWLVTFQQVDGVEYIDSEIAEGPLPYKRDRTYTRAAISFDRIEPDTSTLPSLPTMSTDGALMEP
jgi:hypothetical protein